MSDLLLVGIAGFAAALVDGALGMGFGPTSSTLLLSSGLSPAATSVTVNLAKVATGFASGTAHWRLGNIDRSIVLGLAVPGVIGALIGTTVLANVDGDALRPVLAGLLVIVGLRILHRFSRPIPRPVADVRELDPSLRPGRRHLTGVGAAGGLTNGLIGAWGPVVTPFLLHHRLPPRIVVGSVNTAEVAVAFTAAGSLLGSMGGGSGLEAGVIVAMLLGGVLGAPLAAWVVKVFRPRLLGIAVAGLLLATQLPELVPATLPTSVRVAIFVLLAALVIAAAVRPPILRRRRLRSPEPLGVG